MSNRKSFLAGIGISLVIVFLLLILSGAVIPKSQNYYEDMGRNSNRIPSMHVACSADGSVVYISDDKRVMRSKDYGNDWKILMTNRQSESSRD